MPEQAVRIDVWLWRARFFKSRAQAATRAAEGRIRLRRDGEECRIDKPSRSVRPGDELVFAISSRVIAVRVVALGARRGPASEARELYAEIAGAAGTSRAIDIEAHGHR